MVRVISGVAGKRRLRVPKGLGMRPTSDKVRESVFNILAPWVEGSVFMDLFAGTGAVGIEALSRGAREVIFVEKHPLHLKIIEENLKRCGLGRRYKLLRGDAVELVRQRRLPSADLIFADPPYIYAHDQDLLILLYKNDIVQKFIVYEHPRKKTIGRDIAGLNVIKTYPYGDSALTLMERSRIP
jgi:16S rRNA (guanine(966)-N(2))-methyltransferase RsmD